MSSYRTLRRLLVEMASASPGRTALAVLLTVLLSATEGINILLLIPLLQLVGIGTGQASPAIATRIASVFSAAGIAPTLGGVLAVYVAVVGVRGLIGGYQTVVSVSLREDFTAKLRVRLYAAIVRAEWKFLVTRRASEVVHVLAGGIEGAGGLVFRTIDLGIAIAVSVVYLALGLKLAPVVAGFILVGAGAMALASRGHLGTAKVLGARRWTARGDLHSVISEHVAAMKTAKSYGAIGTHLRIFSRVSDELRTASLEMSTSDTGLQRVLEFSSTAMLAGVVYAALRIGGSTPAELLVVLFVCSRLIPRIVSINTRIHGLAGQLPGIEQIFRLETECLEAAEGMQVTTGKFELRHAIRFDSVTFTYASRGDVPAVEGLNLDIAAGLTTAFVGSSGAGKTTFADLLIGLLMPDSGSILIDGRPITPSDMDGWRRSISYVPQDTFLFHDTVRENLSWSRRDADDESLWGALKLAAADDFVRALPQGLDTIVGERGVMLSGGERQRLSLARALLRGPEVLVLDEATSSLDSETELRIQRAIESLHERMTIVIVTHRLSMISGADMIHVLDHGKLVESGTWVELLANPSGRFSELCRAQGIYERPIARQSRNTPHGPAAGLPAKPPASGAMIG